MVIVTSDSGFGPAEWATIAAALIAAVVAVTGYALTQAWARRERRAKAFADALAAVEDYLEATYRLRRRQASAPEVRAELCSALSDLQARIALHSAWLQVEAPAVAEAHEALVSAARAEAGTQMTDAWNAAPLASDADMNLKVAHLHPGSDVQRLTRSRGDAGGSPAMALAEATLLRAGRRIAHRTWWSKSPPHARSAIGQVPDHSWLADPST